MSYNNCVPYPVVLNKILFTSVSKEEAPGVPPGGHPPGTGAQAAPGAASRSAVPGVGHTPGQAQPSGARPPGPIPGGADHPPNPTEGATLVGRNAYVSK